MNVNSRNSKMEQRPYLKSGMEYRTDMYNLQVRKKLLKKNQELKFTFQNMPLSNNH